MLLLCPLSPLNQLILFESMHCCALLAGDAVTASVTAAAAAAAAPRRK
jgi:hypothetical protein